MTFTTIEELVADIEANPRQDGRHLYHPIPFPEFEHLETGVGTDEFNRKWLLILGTLNNYFDDQLRGLKVVDVGANAGFFSFSLAKLGANVISYEVDPKYAEIGEFLAREHSELSVDWRSRALDISELGEQAFDITIMLSVFQWMAAGGEKMDYAIRQLKHISEKSQCLVFELGFNVGKSCMKTQKINHYAAMIDLLRKYTSYSHFKLLGKTVLWGSPLMKLRNVLSGGRVRYLIFCSRKPEFEDSTVRKLIRNIHI